MMIKSNKKKWKNIYKYLKYCVIIILKFKINDNTNFEENKDIDSENDDYEL